MTHRNASAARGFTLTEVVAVLGIISVLFFLILPALRTSREAADRVSCGNNLRQVILALHHYETENQALPPGVVNPTGPIRNRAEDLHRGWIVSMLPYIEQGSLAGVLDSGLSVYDPAYANTASSQIRTLLCPSDRKAGAPKTPRGAASYAGCHHDVEAPIDVDNHGVFYLNSRVRHEDIPDGSGFTIFVGEKTVTGTDLGWMSGTRATLRNTGTPINGSPPPGAFSTRGSSDDYVGGFGSYHPGGANFAFGDGSVRFLSEQIHPGVLRLLGHRADGEPISDRAF